MSILEFLGMNVDHPGHGIPTAETETVRKIVQKLDQLPEQQARYIAAFAFLLSRAARADLQIDAEETAVMERIVMQQGGLPEELALVVVQIAKTQNQLFGSTENYLVTREFERMATREQKLALLDCLFAVAAADENITSEEDNVVKQIASELKLSHDEYIAARSRYREYLSVLKPGRRDETQNSPPQTRRGGCAPKKKLRSQLSLRRRGGTDQENDFIDQHHASRRYRVGFPLLG